jgi:hypothetical protein
MELILTGLFGGQGTPDSLEPEGNELGGRSCTATVLDLACSLTLVDPQLGPALSAEARRAAQALELDQLFASSVTVEHGGIRARTHRGDLLFDLGALKDELLQRYNVWAGKQGADGEALREAGRAALKYAQECNCFIEQLGGSAALLAGWQAVLLVAFTRRFDLLFAAAGAPSPVELVLSTLEDTMGAVTLLLQGCQPGLARPLCETVQALTARLREQVAAAAALDPVASLPLPSRCHAFLHALLSALREVGAGECVGARFMLPGWPFAHQAGGAFLLPPSPYIQTYFYPCCCRGGRLPPSDCRWRVHWCLTLPCVRGQKSSTHRHLLPMPCSKVSCCQYVIPSFIYHALD